MFWIIINLEFEANVTIIHFHPDDTVWYGMAREKCFISWFLDFLAIYEIMINIIDIIYGVVAWIVFFFLIESFLLHYAE